MTDAALAVVSLIVLLIIGRLAFHDAKHTDEDETKLWK